MTLTNPETVGTCERCGVREGKERYYVPGPFSVAGATMKLSMRRTIGCDPCWKEFTEILKNQEYFPYG